MIWIEITLIILLVVLNGLFALSELAIVSSRKARLEQWANEGDVRARMALDLANAPDSFLSTVQIGITFIGIMAGAFGGATIADVFHLYLKSIPELAAYSQVIAVSTVVIGITYLSLIIGELLPKRLALNNPEKLARLVAPPINRLSRLAHPLVRLLSGSTNFLFRLFRIKSPVEQAVTEEEIKLLIDQGTQAGTFHEFEQEMIERVFRLADRRVTVLMTPRMDIVWLDLNSDEEETKRKIAEHQHSVFPVARGKLDNVIGLIAGKELLALILQGKPFDLAAICRKPLFITETTQAVKVLELFKKTGMHTALVVDEYGSVQGLVTFGDILRSVFEDVEDAFEDEKTIIEREDGSWLISGSMPLDEFFDYAQISRFSEDERSGMNTVGGFVMAQIGAIPSPGQYFEWRNLRIEVVDMDGRRVDKVLVTRMP